MLDVYCATQREMFNCSAARSYPYAIANAHSRSTYIPADVVFCTIAPVPPPQAHLQPTPCLSVTRSLLAWRAHAVASPPTAGRPPCVLTPVDFCVPLYLSLTSPVYDVRPWPPFSHMNLVLSYASNFSSPPPLRLPRYTSSYGYAAGPARLGVARFASQSPATFEVHHR